MRRVDNSGTIATVAGVGLCGMGTGDGGPATAACLTEPSGVAVDAAGNLYIGDDFRTVRRVAANGIITTIAGGVYRGYGGDGGPAVNATLNCPVSLAVDAMGDLLIADQSNNRIREISTTGIITTVVGNGIAGYSGDGGAATAAELYSPAAVIVDGAGSLWIADSYDSVIRQVSTDGDIATVAGSLGGYSGDGGPALDALIYAPQGVALDLSGNLYIADYGNHRVRKVSAGKISTVVGGALGLAPVAASAMFVLAQGVAKDHAGNLYVSDSLNSVVYQITPAGTLSLYAGNGQPGYAGDNGPATAAELEYPVGLAVDSNGALYIADSFNHRIRMVSNGFITTVAGSGVPGYAGDGGAATAARLEYPRGVALDAGGDLLIADSYNSAIREVTANGVIGTVAGTGIAGYSGDGGPATSARLNLPSSVALDSSGNLFIADAANQRIRKVSTGGTIVTVAGTGVAGSIGSSGVATTAQLNNPVGVATDSAGNLYIADEGNDAIRIVTPGGAINTLAGTMYGQGTIGDGPAASATLFNPTGVAVDAAGNVYIADTGDYAVRALTLESGPPALTISSTHTGAFPLGETSQYMLTVSNLALAGGTNGTVTVSEVLPAALTLVSMSGSGWNCSGTSCSRSDALGAGVSYSPITVQARASAGAPWQVTNQAVVTGGDALPAGAQDATAISLPVTIATSPASVPYSVDNLGPQTGTQTFDLMAGMHTIGVSTPQLVGPGMQYAFSNWADGGAADHTIQVTAPVAETATFATQYQLTATVNPAAGGSVTPLSGSYFNAGSTVTVTAVPNAPFVFAAWANGSTANPLQFTISAPTAVAASFNVPGFTCAVTHDGTPSVADVQQMIDEALGAMPPTDDLNGDHVVNVADVEKVVAAAMGLGCVY